MIMAQAGPQLLMQDIIMLLSQRRLRCENTSQPQRLATQVGAGLKNSRYIHPHPPALERRGFCLDLSPFSCISLVLRVLPRNRS